VQDAAERERVVGEAARLGQPQGAQPRQLRQRLDAGRDAAGTGAATGLRRRSSATSPASAATTSAPAATSGQGTRSHHGAGNGPCSARSRAFESAAVIVGSTTRYAVGRRRTMRPDAPVFGTISIAGPGIESAPVAKTCSGTSIHTLSTAP